MIYNHNYTNRNLNNHDLNNIDSVVLSVYINPTISPMVTVAPRKADLTSRGEIIRVKDEKLITEPVVKVDDDNGKVEVKDFTFVDSFVGTITKYTLAYEECLKHSWDKDFGITASGAKVKINHTIAMNRNTPFGTTVKIEGFDNVFTVTDRGGAITGLKIDVYVESRSEAFKWGIQKKKVWILNWGHR